MKNRIIDPRAVPVIQVDSHLPALPAELLTMDFLRWSFGSPPAHWESLSDEFVWRKEGKPVRQAAVLLPLMRGDLVSDGLGQVKVEGECGQEVYVLLMRRSMHLKEHAGQIALPGGKVDVGDKNRIATALRETYEEVGIAAEQVDVLGVMPPYTSASGFEITPVAGVIQEVVSLSLCSDEVSDVFVVPLAFLMDPAQHRWHGFGGQGEDEKDGCSVTRRWLSMEYVWQGRSYLIWGVTAAIIRNLYLFLSASSRRNL